MYSHYWSPHYLPIPCIFFYRKWLGRTLQPEPPRGRNSRHHAALRPLMPLRAPPLNRWTPHYRVSTLGLRHRQVTILYHSTLEFIPDPLKNCRPYFKILLATCTYFTLLPCSQRREGQEILLGLLLQVCRSRPPPHLPEAQHHLLQAVRIHPRRMYSLLLPNQEIQGRREKTTGGLLGSHRRHAA